MRQKVPLSMLATLLVLLMFLSPLISAHSESTGFKTPDTPANPEIRSTFGAWAEQALAPHLAKDVQEKWSAERCRDIANMVQAAGFQIADKYKDELWGGKRKQPIDSAEALAIIVSSQYGEYWEWTAEDKAWLNDLKIASGMQSGKLYYAPAPSDGTASQVIEAARRTICARYGITDEQWQAFCVNADFMAGRADDGSLTNFWALSVMEKWNEGYLFSYCYTPSTGDVELLDLRK